MLLLRHSAYLMPYLKRNCPSFWLPYCCFYSYDPMLVDCQCVVLIKFS
uniref:Uncharacterized protein MANES_01G197300 n=1 Tax=Rhizophora mucronata TaxID=61149 RepID=A0A2P2K4C0_RHIMU